MKKTYPSSPFNTRVIFTFRIHSMDLLKSKSFLNVSNWIPFRLVISLHRVQICCYCIRYSVSSRRSSAQRDKNSFCLNLSLTTFRIIPWHITYECVYVVLSRSQFEIREIKCERVVGSPDSKMHNNSRIGMIKTTFDIIFICFNSFRQIHWNRVNVYFDNLSLEKSTKYTKIFDFRLISVIREKFQCEHFIFNSMLLFLLSALSGIYGFQYFLIKFLSKHRYNRWAPTATVDTCYYLRSTLAFNMGCKKCRRHSLIDSLFVRAKKRFGR